MFLSKPLSLMNALNVRDLGGYPVEHDVVTLTHQFLRADSLHQLEDAEKVELLNYGVRCVIDMRSDQERQLFPYSLPDGMQYVPVPMLDHIQSDGLQGNLPDSLHDLYIQGLLQKSRAEIAQVMKTAVAYPDACVLFHCMAGKDRTGVISMLLLKLAGVPDETIVEDYSATASYMSRLFEQQCAYMQKTGHEKYTFLLDAAPEEMRKTLHYFSRTYPSCRDYLVEIGLSEAEIDVLRRKMIGL